MRRFFGIEDGEIVKFYCRIRNGYGLQGCQFTIRFFVVEKICFNSFIIKK
jgi:hypothetical protein